MPDRHAWENAISTARVKVPETLTASVSIVWTQPASLILGDDRNFNIDKTEPQPRASCQANARRAITHRFLAFLRYRDL